MTVLMAYLNGNNKETLMQ